MLTIGGCVEEGREDAGAPRGPRVNPMELLEKRAAIDGPEQLQETLDGVAAACWCMLILQPSHRVTWSRYEPTLRQRRSHGLALQQTPYINTAPQLQNITQTLTSSSHSFLLRSLLEYSLLCCEDHRCCPLSFLQVQDRSLHKLSRRSQPSLLGVNTAPAAQHQISSLLFLRSYDRSLHPASSVTPKSLPCINTSPCRYTILCGLYS